MFHRRRSHSNPPYQIINPSPAAATAAAQAFLANRASNASLSAAAAAAALRTHTPSPTPVGNVQTKRMVQRRTSNASNGSGNAGGRGGLRRTGSNGSMTERTFRDSPTGNRSNNAPPVPSVPERYASPPPATHKSHRRAASAGPPARINSPKGKQGGRGFSLDRDPSGKTTKPPAQRVESPTNGQMPERSNSRNSINFSYPTQTWNSPPASPVEPEMSSIKEEQSVQASSAEPQPSSSTQQHKIVDPELLLHSTANKHVGKKKRASAPGASEGSHLRSGSTGGRPKGTAVPQTSESEQYQTYEQDSLPASTQSASHSTRKQKRLETSEGTSHPRVDTRLVSYTDLNTSDQSRAFSPRVAGVLSKQPSVVREDIEAEELAERDDEQMNDVLSNPPADPSRKARSTSPPTKSVTGSLTKLSTQGVSHGLVPTQPTDSQSSKRPSSLSPSRSAHFSTHPTIAGLDEPKHEPPSRSVSPAKPALKHSPSLKASTPDRLAPVFAHMTADLSDAASSASEDGVRTRPKKKKSVRVSFEEEPVIVGSGASPPMSPDSPVIQSPQYRHGGKPDFHAQLPAKKISDVPTEEVDYSFEKMVPVPVLPSFGSIRERRPQEAPESHVKNETNGLPPKKWLPSSQRHYPEELHASSDTAIGNLIASHYMNKNTATQTDRPIQPDSNRPLPPTVTSVEGSGFDSGSDTSSDSEDDMGQFANAQDSTTALGQYAGTPKPASQPETEHLNAAVPVIAIQPASPAPGEFADRGEWPTIPGRFPSPNEALESRYETSGDYMNQQVMDSTPASMGLAEPGPREPLVSYSHSKPQTEPQDMSDDSDSGESIYSDAAEDPSELVEMDYGSIDAVVESPAPSSTTAISTPPESPSAQTTASKPSRQFHFSQASADMPEPETVTGRAKFQSTLRDQRTMQNQQTVQQNPELKLDRERPAAQRIPRDQAPLPPWPDRQYRESALNHDSQKTSKVHKQHQATQPDGGEGSHFRESKQNGDARKQNRQAAKTSMRVSMRPNSFQPMPTLAVVPEPKGILHKKNRPRSMDAQIGPNVPASPLHTRHTSTSGDASRNTQSTTKPMKRGAAVAPSLQRVPSDASESSFRRQRVSSRQDGRISMRRTMRGGSIDDRPVPPPLESSRARSASPADSMSRRTFRSNGSTLRTSMRSSSVDRTPSSGTRFSGFGKKTKPKAARYNAKAQSSRFGDSSDEDEAPEKFQSRFQDSSDEENLAPVRGIPRTHDEGDSTDLDDSSDEETAINQSRELPVPSTNGVLVHEPGVDASKYDAIVPTEKKKRSIFGNFGRRKDKVKNTDLNNTVRPLERSSSPKLHRRNGPKKYGSDSWPLPPPQNMAINDDQKPVISDGPDNGLTRPELGPKTQSIEDVVFGNDTAVGSKTGKKKRFPMLRKALGLSD